jgi:predicted AlkP superfamily pyrophosphatase or phosphodiesterase
MKKPRFQMLFICCLLFLSTAGRSQPSAPITGLKPTVVLVSIDGFRYDYFAKASMPNLERLIKNGLRARWLISQFPTKTFPNHYTIVTGLRPENHGIVANTMYDPEFDEVFSLSNREAVTDAKWWGGEPIWVTAETQGQRTAPHFWPGSEAAIGGTRPSYWKQFDRTVPDSQRVQDILHLLDLPADRRPTFLTLYLESLDAAGHEVGPDSSALLPSLRAIDNTIGYLVEGLAVRRILDSVNLIIVSDHGMASLSEKRVIKIDDFVDSTMARIIDLSPVASIWPCRGRQSRSITDSKMPIRICVCIVRRKFPSDGISGTIVASLPSSLLRTMAGRSSPVPRAGFAAVTTATITLSNPCGQFCCCMVPHSGRVWRSQSRTSICTT